MSSPAIEPVRESEADATTNISDTHTNGVENMKIEDAKPLASDSVVRHESAEPPAAAGVTPLGFQPPPFLLKTYEMVDDETTKDMVAWSDNGKR